MEAPTFQRRYIVSILSQKSAIILITAMIVVSQMAGGMYTPRRAHYMDNDLGAESGEDDDMDQTASTPKRNRGDGKSETPDGYEENEPDGAYEETPRDEEGQADVEKFFDDHLGASEREVSSIPKDLSNNNQDNFITSSSEVNLRAEEPPNDRNSKQQLDEYFSNLNKEQKFIKLPTKNILITKESTNPIQRMDDSSDECYECDEPKTTKPPKRMINARLGRINRKTENAAFRVPQEESRTNENNVIAMENDDDDKIYVTNKTNQPFKIDALGGYDPEEDFKSASQDLDDPGTPEVSPNQRGNSKDISSNPQQDIIFNDAENDGPFENASETDEVTFNTDNPYKKEEMEDEIKSSASSKRPNKREEGVVTEGDKSPVDNDSEDSVKGWVNDGVEDMEIPSQTDQDIVLEKAARMEELAQERRDKEKQVQERAQKDNEDQQPDEHSQRMPNADYMKNDMDDEFEDS